VSRNIEFWYFSLQEYLFFRNAKKKKHSFFAYAKNECFSSLILRIQSTYLAYPPPKAILPILLTYPVYHANPVFLIADLSLTRMGTSTDGRTASTMLLSLTRVGMGTCSSKVSRCFRPIGLQDISIKVILKARFIDLSQLKER
jgi:hypothetical protein